MAGGVCIQPVRQLTVVAEHMATGDLGACLFPSTRDEVGQLTHAFNHMADQVRGQVSTLAEEQGRLAAVLDHMADGVLITDDSGQVRLINAAAARLLDTSEEQALGRSFSERISIEKRREEAAAAAERERLARDLHDAVTQSLFSVSAIAEALPSVWERDRAAAWDGLEELRRLTHGALAEMRNLLLELRPSGLKEQRLDALLHQLTEGMTGRTRMPVTTQVTGDCTMPADVQIAL